MKERPECIQFHELMRRCTGQDVMVAFSGGADSALLLKEACGAAKENRTAVYAVTVSTRLHPARDLREAERMAQELGAVHETLTVDEFADERMRGNPRERCYLCKRRMFEEIRRFAAERGIETILEGTNEDDLHAYRPGRRALEELGIVSPLAQCHMTKQMVRGLLAEYGMAAADKPASPCLATRVAYGQRLSEALLDRIDRGEQYLRTLNLYNVRLRVHGEIARIEVDPAEFGVLAARGKEIAEYLKKLGFSYVTMDLEGFRSGSMDEPYEKEDS